MALRVELHSHTHYSLGEKIHFDALHSPKEMLVHAKLLGLDALAITDHNKIIGALEAKKLEKSIGVHVLVGEEVKTQSGHVLGLGLNEFIKPFLSVEETVDLIHAQGGIAIAPHAFDVKGEGIGKLALNCDAMEEFNSLNMDRLSNRKAKKFSLKHSFPTTVGSDAHCKEMIAMSLNLIEASPDTDSILKAIKKQKISFQTSYTPAPLIGEWAVKKLKKSYPFVQAYIEQNYVHPKKFVAEKMLSLVRHSPGPIDSFFKGLSYFSLGNAFLYALARELVVGG